MDIGSMNSRSAQPCASAWIDRNIRSSNRRQDSASIYRCVSEGGIAMDCANPQEIDGGVVSREKNREGVLSKVNQSMNLKSYATEEYSGI
jgi:hypothetical protein